MLHDALLRVLGLCSRLTSVVIAPQLKVTKHSSDPRTSLTGLDGKHACGLEEVTHGFKASSPVLVSSQYGTNRHAQLLRHLKNLDTHE